MREIRMPSGCFPRAGLPRAAAAFAAAALAGCVSVVPHQPNLRIIEEMGPDAAARRLAETLSRAVTPRITSAEVTADYVRYRWNVVVEAFWVPVGAVPQEAQIYFANIEKVEVYENANVFIHGRGGRIEKVLFSNLDDARLLSDFLQAYRALRGGGAAPVAG